MRYDEIPFFYTMVPVACAAWTFGERWYELRTRQVFMVPPWRGAFLPLAFLDFVVSALLMAWMTLGVIRPFVSRRLLRRPSILSAAFHGLLAGVLCLVLPAVCFLMNWNATALAFYGGIPLVTAAYVVLFGGRCRTGRCARCAYDITASLDVGRCPECGVAI